MTAAQKSLVEVRFLEFWKAYPKKTGKQYALKAWNKIKPTAELHERIMQAVDAQKRSDQWRRENGRYIPNPSTWLNGGYWDNEEVNEGAENQRDPEQPDSSGRDWGKGLQAGRRRVTPATGSGATMSASPAVPESLSPFPASSAAPCATTRASRSATASSGLPTEPSDAPVPRPWLPTRRRRQSAKLAEAAAAKAEEEKKMRERIKRIVGESGMGDRFLRRTFSTFQLTDDNKRAAAAARRYAEGFDAMLPQPGRQEPGRNGLFIAGPPGTGKTHLAAAIANHLIAQGKPVICMTMIDLLERIKRTYSATGGSESDVLKI
ncbi:MAG: ATP-binding protein [Dysosmobacter sp.]